MLQVTEPPPPPPRNPDKLERPICLSILDIELDSTTLQAQLPPEKRERIISLLGTWSGKQFCKRRMSCYGQRIALVSLVSVVKPSSQLIHDLTLASIWQLVMCRLMCWWIPHVWRYTPSAQKTDPFRMAWTIDVDHGNCVICPVVAISNFSALHGPVPGLLF